MAETTDDLVVCPVGNDSSQRPKTRPKAPKFEPRSPRTLIKPRGLKQISKSDKEWDVIDASVAGDLDKIIELKDRGIDINVFTPLGETPVHCACRNGNLDCVQWLLANSSIPPDFGDIDGETAVHAAAKWGNIGCVHWLLNNTAISPDHRSWSGNNIMHLAVYREKTELIKLILRHDLICADLLNNDGLTAWDTAVKLYRYDIVELLINTHWFLLVKDCLQKVLFPVLRDLTVPRGEIIRRTDNNTSWCLVLNPSIEVLCQQRDLKIMSSKISSFLAAIHDPTVRFDLFMNKRNILNKALKLTIDDQVTVLIDNDTNTITIAVIRYIGQLPGKRGCYFGIELLEETHLGNTDGTYKSEVMFSCPSGSGLFVTIDKICLTVIDENVMSEYEKQCVMGKSTSRSYKVTVVGPARAGKTSCIRTLLDKPFNSREPSTLGATLNSQAIVSLLRSWPQEHELQKGIKLDTYVAVNWKEASIEDLVVLLDKEYKTEMYERLEKCIKSDVSHCISQIASKEGSPIDSEAEQYFECYDSLTDLNQMAASIRSENIPDDTSSQTLGSYSSLNRREVFDCVKKVVLGDKTDRLAVKVSFSDFAGQMRFFHFQLLFLKRQDVVVLTINATMDPRGPLMSRNQSTSSSGQSRSGMMTPIQAFHCWLQTVSAHSGTSNVPIGSLSRRSPTVITCFTHAEQLSERQQQNIIHIYRDTLNEKNYAAHLPDDDKDAFHMISNKSRKRFSKNIRHLKETLVKAAKPILNELRPITYLKLEELIGQKINNNVNTLSLCEFTHLANQAGIQGDAGSIAISASLDYCSKRGIVLYFAGIVSLHDIVFISPQWLCTLLSHVIKAHDLRPREAHLQQAWRRYDQYGILEERFLDFVLHDAGILQHKEIILALTMHFYLLSEIPSNTKLVEEPMTPSPEGRVYIVPALLTSTPRQHHYKPSDSDQALLFSFPDGYFPESIMNHIFAKTINWSVSNGYSIQEVSHGFGRFGLGCYQCYHLIYDFSRFCLKICVAQLSFYRKRKEYHLAIVDDFKSLIEHLEQSIDEIMDIFISKATKPVLYVLCPFCGQNVTPHIKFNISTPVLCCELGDIPQELARSSYIPFGIDLENLKKPADDQLGLPQDHTTSEKCTISINSDLQGSSASVVNESDGSRLKATQSLSKTAVPSDDMKEYTVFKAFHARLSAVLSVSSLSPHLVSAGILSVNEDKELDAIINTNKKAAYVLGKVVENLKKGSTQIFYFLLLVIEKYGDNSSIQLVSDIKREIVAYSDEVNKEYKIFLHYYGKLALTLPVTILCHHLVTKKVITTSEVEEIHALPTSSRKAVHILRKISASLEAGQTDTFNVFLSVVEEHGNVDSIQLVSDMKKEIVSAAGHTSKQSCLTRNPKDGVVFTSAPQRNDLVEYVCSQISTKCYIVGKCLGLDKEVLDQIKDKFQGKDLEASYEIMLHWLFHSSEPTWKNLLAVLASDKVGEYTLAQLLNEKFVVHGIK